MICFPCVCVVGCGRVRVCGGGGVLVCWCVGVGVYLCVSLSVPGHSLYSLDGMHIDNRSAHNYQRNTRQNPNLVCVSVGWLGWG
jgi:hypothetical protein